MDEPQMNYLSVCSGIEAATVAWHHMGWKPVGFSEIEKFPSQVLAHHYPQVTNFGDMTKYKEWKLDDSIGLLVGGTPCQSFSVAGLRKGLDDPRGNLALTYVGILDKFRPKWCIWENVPGVLSSGGGRDFGSFLGALGELGYGWAYRVLDAQNFGVAQRRRRVFVVGCLGGWESAAKVLFESESLSGNIAKGRSSWEETTTVAGISTQLCGPLTARDYKGISSDDCNERYMKMVATPKIASCLETTCNDYSRADGFNMILQPIPIHAQATQYKGGGANRNNDGKGNGLGIGKPGDPMNTLTTNNVHAVAYENHPSDSRVKEMGEVCQTVTSTWGSGGGNIPFVQNVVGSSEISGTLRANPGSGWRSNGTPVEAVAIQNMAVRRLTEVECERLQGFPNNYTNIKENCPSGVRYKALGNSMAVPVMRWIGERINNYERL
jgi:DNA (cytosine-5)-methyltransferase 1